MVFWGMPDGDTAQSVKHDLPRLLDRAAMGNFAAFNTFWTALVLPLTAPGSELSHTQVGLFGLVGIAGAIAAYMVLYSLGSATGAAIAPFMYSLWGWAGVCMPRGVISVTGLLLWTVNGGFQEQQSFPPSLWNG